LRVSENGRVSNCKNSRSVVQNKKRVVKRGSGLKSGIVCEEKINSLTERKRICNKTQLFSLGIVLGQGSTIP
jgi:hypothetical protein